jgi:hypothetical protein
MAGVPNYITTLLYILRAFEKRNGMVPLVYSHHELHLWLRCLHHFPLAVIPAVESTSSLSILERKAGVQVALTTRWTF